MQGDTTIVASSLANKGGVVNAAGNADVEVSGAVDNSAAGLLQAVGDMTVIAGSIDDSDGSIAADGTVLLKANTINVPGGKITAPNVSLTFSEASGLGDGISASNDLVLNVAGDFDNAAGVSIGSSHDLTIVAAGTITNEGALSAGGVATISAKTITNTGNIFGDSIGLNAEDAVTNGDPDSSSSATIAAASDLHISTAGKVTNISNGTATDPAFATLYSGGTLAITGPTGQGRAGTVLNSSGVIQAQGAMTLAADVISNTRTKFSTADQVVSFTPAPVYPSHPDMQQIEALGTFDGGLYKITPYGKDVNFSNVLYSETVTDTTITADSGQSEILGGSIAIDTGRLDNDVSTISASGDLTIDGSVPGPGGVSGAIINNTAVTLVETVDDEGATHYGKEHSEGTFGSSPSPPSIDVAVVPFSSKHSTDLGTVPSIIVAGGAIAVHAITIVNTNSEPAGTVAVDGPKAHGVIASVLAPADSNQLVAAHAGLSLSTISSGVSAAGSSALPTIAKVVTDVDDGAQVALATNSGAAPMSASLPETQLAAAIFKVPTVGLFVPTGRPNAEYLVQINPDFPPNPNSISSDRYLTALGYDPAAVEQRLGDGQYEEQLVGQQLLALTGTERLATFSSATDQYASLLDAGVAYEKQFNLALGVGLSAEQMATLTSDIVLMVNQTVQSSTGPKQVLVPVVYLASTDAKDVSTSGALIAANDIDLRTANSLQNSGEIRARNSASVVSYGDVLNNGIINAGAVGRVVAANDIDSLGGTIKGGNVTVAAGNNLSITSTTVTSRAPSDVTTGINRTGTIAVTGNLALSAGNALTLDGASIASGGTLSAQANSIDLGTIQKTTKTATIYVGHAVDNVANVGTVINAGGSATFVAANDLSATGATVNAQGTLTALAGRSITLANAIDSSTSDTTTYSHHTTTHTVQTDQTVQPTTLVGGQGTNVAAGFSDPNGTLNIAGSSVTAKAGPVALAGTGGVTVQAAGEEHDVTVDKVHTSQGLLSSSHTTSHDMVNTNTAIASTVSGDTVTVQSDRDVAITGANLASTNGTSVYAKGDVTVTAGTNTDREEHDTSHSTSGVFGQGIGIVVGTTKKSSTSTINATTAAPSLVGSMSGDVNIDAGGTVRITGSNIVPGNGTLSVTGRDVTIGAVEQTSIQTNTNRSSSAGLSVGLGGGVVSTVQAIAGAVSAAGHSSDSRVQALNAVAGARGIYDLANSAPAFVTALKSLGDGDLSSASGALNIQLGISIGGSSSSRNDVTNTTSWAGSSLSAENIRIAATGTGSEGAISIAGSTIQASQDEAFSGQSIHLAAAANVTTTSSTSSDAGGSLGIAIGGGGLSVNASGYAMRANSADTATTMLNTMISAGDRVTVTSAGDVTLDGAQVHAPQIVSNIGGNLAITSLQDADTQKAMSQSIGGGVSVGLGSGAWSGSFSAQDSHGSGNLQTVVKPSGLFAGDGGYQLTVKGNTILVGGDITSSQAAANDNLNRLTTGTLNVLPVANSAQYDAHTSGISFSVSSIPGGTGVLPAMPQSGARAQTSVTAGGMTLNTSSPTVTIVDPFAQLAETGQSDSQTIATLVAASQGLNTDTASTLAHTLSANPNLAAVITSQQDLQTAAGAAGVAVARTEGDIADRMEADATNAGDMQGAADWAEGGANRAVLQGLGGALVSGLGGGNPLAGGAGAMASQFASPWLSEAGNNVADMLGADQNGPVANLTTNVLSDVAGALAGGGNGASQAATFDAFNRQLDQTEINLINNNAHKFAQLIDVSDQQARDILGREAFVLDQTGAIDTDMPQQRALARQFLQQLAQSQPSEDVGNDMLFNGANEMDNAGINRTPSILAQEGALGIVQPNANALTAAVNKKTTALNRARMWTIQAILIGGIVVTVPVAAGAAAFAASDMGAAGLTGYATSSAVSLQTAVDAFTASTVALLGVNSLSPSFRGGVPPSDTGPIDRSVTGMATTPPITSQKEFYPVHAVQRPAITQSPASPPGKELGGQEAYQQTTRIDNVETFLPAQQGPIILATPHIDIKPSDIVVQNSAADDGGESASKPDDRGDFTDRYLSGSGGRWGSQDTRSLNYAVGQVLVDYNLQVTGGGGVLSEEYIRGAGPGTLGGTYVDTTAKSPAGDEVRVQTISTLSDGITPTAAEMAAANRIKSASPNGTLILIPKGASPSQVNSTIKKATRK